MSVGGFFSRHPVSEAVVSVIPRQTCVYVSSFHRHTPASVSDPGTRVYGSFRVLSPSEPSTSRRTLFQREFRRPPWSGLLRVSQLRPGRLDPVLVRDSEGRWFGHPRQHHRGPLPMGRGEVVWGPTTFSGKGGGPDSGRVDVYLWDGRTSTV